MIEKTNNLFEDKEIKELKTLLEENQRQLNLLTFDYKENSGDNTNKTQINEQKWLDNVQTVFDWAGLVPVYGDAIDVINALISFTRASAQGKFMPHGLNGIISVIAIIPVVGSVIAIPFKMIFKFIPVASATKIIKELTKGTGEGAATLLEKSVKSNPKALNAFNKFKDILIKNIDAVLKGTRIIKKIFKGLAIIPLTKLDDKLAAAGVALIVKLEKFLIKLSKSGGKAATKSATKLSLSVAEVPVKLLTKRGRLVAKGFGFGTIGGKRIFYASQDMFSKYLQKSGTSLLSKESQNAIFKQSIKNISGPAMKSGESVSQYMLRTKLGDKLTREFTNLTILNNPKIFKDYLNSSDASQRFSVFIKTITDRKVIMDATTKWGQLRKTMLKAGLGTLGTEYQSKSDYIKQNEKDMYKKQSSDKNKKGSHYGQKREM
jgi:hypothetical protein